MNYLKNSNLGKTRLVFLKVLLKLFYIFFSVIRKVISLQSFSFNLNLVKVDLENLRLNFHLVLKESLGFNNILHLFDGTQQHLSISLLNRFLSLLNSFLNLLLISFLSKSEQQSFWFNLSLSLLQSFSNCLFNFVLFPKAKKKSLWVSKFCP